MQPVLPILTLAGHSQKSFVHKSGGLKRMIAALTSKLAARYAAKFVVHQRHELVQSPLVAVSKLLQEFVDLKLGLHGRKEWTLPAYNGAGAPKRSKKRNVILQGRTPQSRVEPPERRLAGCHQ
jgi:hypothetical protein